MQAATSLAKVLCGAGLAMVGLAAGGLSAARAADAIPPGAIAQMALSDLPPIQVEAQSTPSVAASPEAERLFREARASAGAGEVRDALRLLEEAARQPGGDRFEVWYEVARLAEAVDDDLRLREGATRAVERNPRHPAALYLAGKLAMRAGQMELAERHFRACTQFSSGREHSPFSTASWLLLARVLEGRGYWRAAAEAYERFDESVFRTHPEHRYAPAVAELLAAVPRGTLDRQLKLWKWLNDTAGAIQAAENAVRRQPNDQSIATLYVEQLVSAGRAAEAIAFARQRLADNPDPTVGFLRPALVAARSVGKLDEWVAEIVAGAEQSQRTELLTAVAGRLNDGADLQRATALWGAAARLKPRDAEAAWRYAWACWRSGAAETAVRALAEFIARCPHDGAPAGWAMQSRIQAHAGPCPAEVPAVSTTEERLALKLLALAEGETPGNAASAPASAPATAPASAPASGPASADGDDELPAALLATAAEALDRYDWAAAYAAAEEARTRMPRSAAAFFLRAKALLALGDTDAAEEDLRAAVRLDNRNALYAYELGRLYQDRDGEDLLAAQRYFQSALSIDPRFAPAAERLLDSYLDATPPKVELAELVLRAAQDAELPRPVLDRMAVAYAHADQRWSAAHVEALAQLYEADPSQIEAGRRYVTGLLARGDAQRAMLIMTALRQLDPKDEDLLRLEIAVYARLPNYAAAIAGQKILAQRYPKRFREQYELAILHLNNFEPEPARRGLEALLKTPVSDAQRDQLRTSLFQAYHQFRETRQAVALAEGWGDSSINWERIILSAWVEAKEYDQAVELAKKILGAGPANPAERELFLIVCEAAHRPEIALEYIDRWSRDDDSLPERIAWDLRRVEMLRQAGRFDDALKAIADALARLPGGEGDTPPIAGQAVMRVPLIAAQVRVLSDAKRFDEAAALGEEWLARKDLPDNLQVRQILQEAMITAARESRQFDRLLDWLSRWSTQNVPPLVSRIYGLWRMQVLQLSGRHAEYVQAAEAALAENPLDPGMNNDLGYTLADHGEQLERAERMIRHAIASSPLNAAYLDSLGWVMYKQGRMAEAVEWLRRATRLVDGQDATLYDHLGDAEYRNGDPAAAIRAWEKGLRLAEQESKRVSSTLDPEVLPRLSSKLSAAREGRTPPIAPPGPAEAPATAPERP
jgi:tetratricopeptide (TPR) repeat protein